MLGYLNGLISKERNGKSFGSDTSLGDYEIEDIRNNLYVMRRSLDDQEAGKFRQLYQFIEMMMVDGKVKGEEKILCQELARSLDFHPTVVEELIDSIESAISKGDGPDETRLRVAALLSSR
jgi:hypothetical protein